MTEILPPAEGQDLGPGPLSGVRVVELASFISGPLATMMLSDLGAEVIKVESPKGDPFRRFGRSGAAMSPLFVNVNRGKQGFALDLKKESEQRDLQDLLDTADVMLCNWRPAVAARLGVVDEDVARRNRRLIRVYVSGFGSSGPLADRPVYDTIIQGHVGAAERSPPTIAGSYVVDKTAAAMVCQATLAALLAREQRGVAERIDVALLDAAAYVNFPDAMANRTFVDDAPSEAANRQLAAARAIRAADGWLVVVPVTADQIRRTCSVIGRPQLAAELLSIKDATKLTVRLMDEVEAVTLTAPVESWVQAFEENDVPAGPCLTIDEHLADAQVSHNHIYDVIDWDGLGRVRRVRYPARFSTWGELWNDEPPPTVTTNTEKNA